MQHSSGLKCCRQRIALQRNAYAIPIDRRAVQRANYLRPVPYAQRLFVAAAALSIHENDNSLPCVGALHTWALLVAGSRSELLLPT